MSHGTPIRVEHVGVAVEEIETAEVVFRALGAEKYVDDTGPNGEFRWAGYELGDASGLELVAPLSEESFLRGYLDEYGPGLHHVTFEVADIDAVVEALEAADVGVVDRAVHDVYEEAFVSPRNPTGALFQLMEYRDGYAEKYGDDAFVRGRPVGQAETR